MTMKITIKNEDAARTAVAREESFKVGESRAARTDEHVLGPGQSVELWIHASKRVTVEEVV